MMLINGVASGLISIRDRGLLYGDGVFRTLCARQGLAVDWPLHYQKLQEDCAKLGIACPDSATLSGELERLLVQHPNGVIKLIVTRGQGVRGYTPSAQGSVTHIWDITALPDYPADYPVKGIKVRLCQLRLAEQARLAGIKHLNRLENVLAAAEWDDTDIAEGILLDHAGRVIEGTRSNIFCVMQNILVTPDLSRCGVAGVQRDRVMKWAAQHDMALQVRDLTLDELWHADEIFLVNSVIGLWPVRELEQCCWHDFSVAAKIRNDFAYQAI